MQLAGTLTPGDFLTLAIQITAILAGVHQHQVIHKDINPSNIVLNPQTGQVKLIDFGISTRLAHETATFRNPEVLEGTLAYLSPEQTGRMNRAIDYRSDFYSLGVTFYELLTGQRPFPTRDLLELVHAHIAKIPPRPTSSSRRFPRSSAPSRSSCWPRTPRTAISRHMACRPTWRNAGASGRPTGRIEPFLLGRHDVADRLQLPQKLYGRERERRQCWPPLTGSLVRRGPRAQRSVPIHNRTAAGNGGCRYRQDRAGAGGLHAADPPARLLPGREVRPVPAQHPLRLAERSLSGPDAQLLTESDDSIAAWRKRLLAALGPNGQVIIEVIPEVELIIGPQPAVPNLGPTEAHNRFNLVFQRLSPGVCHG